MSQEPRQFWHFMGKFYRLNRLFLPIQTRYKHLNILVLDNIHNLFTPTLADLASRPEPDLALEWR
jgi:hypothetical protein